MIGSKAAPASIASCIRHPCPHLSSPPPRCSDGRQVPGRITSMGSSKYMGFERIYSSAVRLAASAFIQDPLTLDVVVNAPALTNHGIAIARDRLRHLSRKRTSHGLQSR